MSESSISSSKSQIQSSNKLAHVSDTDNIWLLPDGVSDLLSDEAQKQEWLRYKLTRLLISRGYELICPPMIEFTESLLGNASEDLKRQTFKIIDQLSGRLMGVRADITPQILRIDAHLNKMGKANEIARYCYAGHVIRTLPNGLFGSRTPLQLGAEIFGSDSLDADIELIDVLYALIDNLNLKDHLHIDIGHVAIFARLKELAGLSDSDADVLMNLYANKALPELQHICADLPMGSDFYQLAVHGHDMAALKQALSDTATQDDAIIKAVKEVQTMVAHIKQTYQSNVSVDITELGYHYHTGIVFNAYFDNESQAVVRGGRFNGESFSAAAQQQTAIAEELPSRSATGFSLEVTRLQRYISLNEAKLVLVRFADMQGVRADDNTQLAKDLDNKIAELRDLGHKVVRPLSEHDVPNNVTHQLVLEDGEWVLTAV
ncbi:ATP phosphoribosyltransferase regulatory subunit [Psychrobacter sp. FDAARGOS_221]|uniref:ATP phosphoribosyltransferase regulatory subunit n=1 Tax=Psychrobacter sp. FDAARGOS_221 TaxID=1975705 RepID=UPI000BB53393|nr:ATP phosphoribosyltransferase regulatory subunit [Psychrobacter sp. FDAARGOS_221]PNK61359.1 ATP phosphoribosyltransferase regulatory subunit [Psychrobacter sp. FDAARGOS_221]